MSMEKLLGPLRRKIAQLVSRGVVNLVNDALKMQECQITVMADETLDGVERFQQYGFTSVPQAGAESITLSVGGNRSHSVCIAVDDRRYRLKNLVSGEVALYTDQGDKIHIKRGGVIDITAATKITVNAPLVEVPSGDVVASGISLKNHTHSDPQGGNTGAPQ